MRRHHIFSERSKCTTLIRGRRNESAFGVPINKRKFLIYHWMLPYSSIAIQKLTFNYFSHSHFLFLFLLLSSLPLSPHLLFPFYFFLPSLFCLRGLLYWAPWMITSSQNTMKLGPIVNRDWGQSHNVGGTNTKNGWNWSHDDGKSTLAAVWAWQCTNWGTMAHEVKAPRPRIRLSALEIRTHWQQNLSSFLSF